MQRPSSRRRRAPRARAVVAGVAVLIVACAASCSGGSSAPAATEPVVEWARVDLGFEDRAACLVPYVQRADVADVALADLRRQGLAAVPLASRQAVADALVVCGIAEDGG